jgi:hypothetical protein
MLKSLPTALTTADLNSLIAGFPNDKRLNVSRYDTVITVSMALKDKTVKLLSAVTNDGKYWHVMAKEGLISTSFA